MEGGRDWPFVKQPFRSWPELRSTVTSRMAVSLYVSLCRAARGDPDWRIAAVDATSGRLGECCRWIDLRAPPGSSREAHSSPLPFRCGRLPANSAIYPNPYLVALNQYANFATVIDTVTDQVIGEFQTGFYGEKLTFNRAGTRLYMTDRFKDQVRVFDITRGPSFNRSPRYPRGRTISSVQIRATLRSATTKPNCMLPIRWATPSP